MIELQPNDRFSINPSVRTRELDDELIVLDLEQGEYFSLNGTGREVWNALGQGADLATVERDVCAHWPIPPDDAIPMITGLVRDLLERGLIARRIG
jgi:hypothetical protein